MQGYAPMQIKLLLEISRGHNWPTILISDCDISEIISDTGDVREILVRCCPTKNEIKLVRSNKDGSETVVVNGQILRDQTVTLKKIWVDDILLDLDLVLEMAVFRNEFTDDYINYCAERSVEMASVESHWHTWYFNGIWQWTFDEPFWPWYARQKRDYQNKHLSKEHIELYVGTSAKNHQDLMHTLRELLQNDV